MSNPSGSFIWYELMTPDPDAVAPFYAAVVGWTIGAANPAQSGGMDYRMIAREDGGSAGGVLRLSADMLQHGARPVWLPYLYSPNVDGAISGHRLRRRKGADARDGPARRTDRDGHRPAGRTPLPDDPPCRRRGSQTRPAMCSIGTHGSG